MFRKDILLIFFMLLATYAMWLNRDYLEPSDLDMMAGSEGALVLQGPLQKTMEDGSFTFRAGNTLLIPVALFDITGLTLGKKRYLFDDESAFSSIDIGLGWGPMSDPAILKSVTSWQAGRLLHHRSSQVGIDESMIRQSSSNLIIIPANNDIKHKINRIREGNLVRLTGYLVNVESLEQNWKTSTSRTDTGLGSAEILYVQDVDLRPS